MRLINWVLWSVLILTIVLILSGRVNAEYVPREARVVAGTLHSPDEVITYIQDNFEYRYSSRQRSFYTAWNTKLGDCTEFNHVLGAFFLREKGIKFVRVRGYADCGFGLVRHDWLLLGDGAVFDVLDYCHDYKGG